MGNGASSFIGYDEKGGMNRAFLWNSRRVDQAGFPPLFTSLNMGRYLYSAVVRLDIPTIFFFLQNAVIPRGSTARCF